MSLSDVPPDVTSPTDGSPTMPNRTAPALPQAELCRLIESNDLHALMVRVGELWLSRYYPAAPWGQLSAYLEPGVPCPAHTITPCRPQVS